MCSTLCKYSSGGEFILLGLRIRRIREELGLSQQELARRAELSSDAIHKIETLKRSPRVDTLISIGRGLGISAAALLVDLD